MAKARSIGKNRSAKSLNKGSRKPAVSPRRASPRTRKGPIPTRSGTQTIYLLSDSTGNLARHMLTAFLTQFPREAFTVQALTFLQDTPSVQRALDRISASPGIVFHALVSKDAKGAVESRCREHSIPVCDLTGDFVNFLSTHSGIAPREDTSRLHHTDELYHGRIRAIEFALAHDDGLGLDTLHEAHLVLTGISRTSKTPTTIYLAQQGYKVGNVALSMDVPPPAELLNLPPNKVVGLLIDAAQLIEIRTRRQREWGMADSRYNDDDYVHREIAWSQRLFRERGWRTVNVTDQAIEETAARVLEIVGFTRPPTA